MDRGDGPGQGPAPPLISSNPWPGSVDWLGRRHDWHV